MIDYLIFANVENYKRFYEKHKKEFVSENYPFACYFTKGDDFEWHGLLFKIKGKKIVLVLDYDVKWKEMRKNE